MKRFYKKKRVNYILIMVISVIINLFIIFNNYIKDYSKNIIYFTKIKINEITNYYLNDVIKEYLNINTTDYININYVNNSIVSVDIDSERSNELLKRIIGSLEYNIKRIEKGKFENYHNLELIKGDNGIVVLIPIGIVFNNALFANILPKIPIKINFLENINAYLDVEVENYGINNSLIKLYINVEIYEYIEMPLNNEGDNLKYRFLVSSKLISGEVPSVYGGVISSNGSIVKNSVNQYKTIDN